MTLRIDIISPALPPKLDGIGDYTARLASEIALTEDVRILTTRGDHTPIRGVDIVPAFEYNRVRSVQQLPNLVASRRPACVLLQYQPFAYGRWGLNPFLPLAIRRIREASPSTRIIVMIHEPFVPVLDWKHRIMTTWQQWQLRTLGNNADVVFLSIEPWARQFQSWFPNASVRHLPIASNIPRIQSSRKDIRELLEIDNRTVVLGLFGQAHGACVFDNVLAAWSALVREGYSAIVLYVGPQTERVTHMLDGARLITTGALEPEDVSRHFAAMDIFLSPFVDGVSTRRGSMMAALEHGLPVVGTEGINTDMILSQENGKSLLLAPAQLRNEFAERVVRLASDPALRGQLGLNGQKFYNASFSWDRIASAVIAAAGERQSKANGMSTGEMISR